MEDHSSRTLSREEFLKVLQLEYFSHKLRTLIYSDPVFIKMSVDIAEKKKNKIMGLSKRYGTLTMFDNPKLFEFYFRNEFVQEYGLPQFQYTPKTASAVSYWDKVSLLREGSTVIWNKKEYEVELNYPNDEVVKLIKDNELREVPYIDLKIKLLYTISLDSLR